MSVIDLTRKPEVRSDFVPVDAYVSREYAELERQRLWPRTWLLACREEEVEDVGDFVRFDIADESILIVRSDADTVKAFYNVCQHRGRQLKDEYSGNAGKQFACNFHGWRYRLSGEVVHISHEEDWAGCPQFRKEALGLKPVRLETWGGWIFISMDPDIEPLLDYLSPIPAALAPFEFEKLRIGWRQSVVVRCNWKVTVDAFNEAYHAFHTHEAVKADIYSGTRAHGRHGAVLLPFFGSVPDDVADVREAILDQQRWQVSEAKCMATKGSILAAEQLQSLPKGTPNAEICRQWLANFRQIIEASGASWPSGLTSEFMAQTPGFWHVFPNTTFVPSVDAVLWHRMRPWGEDPACSVWDVWSLERPVPGDHRRAPLEFFPDAPSYRGQNPFLEGDISNMEAVQRGMRSRGFAGARTNPVQEITVSNFHRVLYDYLHTR
jgi:phenylpropionate dioxygenase-like ring-hydroxylating dioxygenase large terminal subunit